MRTISQALQWAERQSESPTENWTNRCLRFSRSCYEIPAKYGNAAIAWKKAKHKHPGDKNPPKGALAFWTGGSHGYGHVALCDGTGFIWSNDILRRGKIDRVHLTSISQKWGLKYEGWAEDVNGVHFYKPQPSSWYAVVKRQSDFKIISHAADARVLASQLDVFGTSQGNLIIEFGVPRGR